MFSKDDPDESLRARLVGLILLSPFLLPCLHPSSFLSPTPPLLAELNCRNFYFQLCVFFPLLSPELRVLLSWGAAANTSCFPPSLPFTVTRIQRGGDEARETSLCWVWKCGFLVWLIFFLLSSSLALIFSAYASFNSLSISPSRTYLHTKKLLGPLHTKASHQVHGSPLIIKEKDLLFSLSLNVNCLTSHDSAWPRTVSRQRQVQTKSRPCIPLQPGSVANWTVILMSCMSLNSLTCLYWRCTVRRLDFKILGA